MFGGPPYGIGIFTAGLILSIMILPFISAVTRDVFETVPAMLKEATYGLGCTTWEVMWRVVLPFARPGVVGGAMLALGRALGETMAVTFVIGNAHTSSHRLFAPGTTISATIANEFTEAIGALYTSSLIELGLILFFITFIVLACAQLMLRSLERQAGTQMNVSRSRLYLRRRVTNGVFIALSFAAAIFGLIWLGFILSALLSEGFSAISPNLFTQSTPPPGAAGRTCERHSGQRADERDRGVGRHADRPVRGHLSGRIWHAYAASPLSCAS